MTSPRLHYEAHEGEGPYLLLVHGILSSRAQFLLNIEALSRVARPVVVELFGHGRSPSPEDAEAYTPVGYVREFERIREEMGVERWAVCGQSLGAALTLRYALDLPERFICHVFTNSNSALADDAWAERVRPAMEAQARRLASDGRRALDEHPLNPARSKRMPGEVAAAFVEDGKLLDPRGIALTGLHTVPESSVRARVDENVVPTLLTLGVREERFGYQAAFAERAMPRLRVVRLDGGHAVNIDAAGAWNAAVTSFIREHA